MIVIQDKNRPGVFFNGTGRAMDETEEGLDIIAKSLVHLQDIDSGYFERFVLALRQLFRLNRDHFCDPESLERFVDITARFDRGLYDEKQDFIFKNISAMEKDTLGVLASDILALYGSASIAAGRKREKAFLAEKVKALYSSLHPVESLD